MTPTRERARGLFAAALLAPMLVVGVAFAAPNLARDGCTPASSCGPDPWCDRPALSCATEVEVVAMGDWPFERVLVDPAGGVLGQLDGRWAWLDGSTTALKPQTLNLKPKPGRIDALVRHEGTLWIVGASQEQPQRWPVSLSAPGDASTARVDAPPRVEQVVAAVAAVRKTSAAVDRCMRSSVGCQRAQSVSAEQARAHLRALVRGEDAPKPEPKSRTVLGGPRWPSALGEDLDAAARKTLEPDRQIDGRPVRLLADVAGLKLWVSDGAMGRAQATVEVVATGALYRADHSFGTASSPIGRAWASALELPPGDALLPAGEGALLIHRRLGRLRALSLRVVEAAGPASAK